MNPEIRDAAAEVINEWRSVGYRGSRLRSALTKLDLLLTEDEKPLTDARSIVFSGTRYELSEVADPTLGIRTGEWRVMWQSAQMAGPAFEYFDSVEQATDYCTLESEAYRAKWLS